jgi:hypothetical protein
VLIPLSGDSGPASKRCRLFFACPPIDEASWLVYNSDIGRDVHEERPMKAAIATAAANLLKTHGYTSRQVSVRREASNTHESLTFTIRATGVDRRVIDRVAKSFREVSHCPVTGETLGGGNTYVSVRMAA